MVEHAPQNFVEDPCMSMLMESMPFRDKRSLSYPNTDTDVSSGSINERAISSSKSGFHNNGGSNAAVTSSGAGASAGIGAGSHHGGNNSHSAGGTNYSTSSINVSSNIVGQGGSGLIRIPSMSRNSASNTNIRSSRKGLNDRLSSKRTSTISSMSVGTKDDGEYAQQNDGIDNASNGPVYGDKVLISLKVRPIH